jgi:hypothetical protein
MKPVKVTVVKAIKIDAGPYRTKSYRSAHTAAQDYASKSNEVWFSKMSPADKAACYNSTRCGERFDKVFRRVKPIFAAMLK